MGATEKITTLNGSLEIKHLKKSFNENVVLDDISLKLAKGENIVILGK